MSRPKFSRFLLTLAGIGLFVVGLILPSSTPAQAAVGINKAVNYQGRLLSNTGAVVADGTYNMRFRIYQDGPGNVAGDTGGTLKWTEIWQVSNTQGVSVRNGYFNMALGTICTFGGSVCQGNTNTAIDWNQDTLWLSADIGGTSNSATPTYDGEMLPMKRMSATPYALQADNASKLGGLSSSQFLQTVPASSTVNVIAPTAASTVALTVKGTTGTAANVLEIYNSNAAPTRQAFFDSAGSLNVAQVIQPTTGNSVDVGLTGTTFRTGYFGTSLITPLLSSAAATALTITGNAASTWSTSIGDLSIQAAANLNLGNAGGTNINVGTNNAAHTIGIGNSGATGTQAISIGGSGNAANTLSLEAGTGAASLAVGNGATAHNIQIGTGAAVQTVALGSLNGASATTINGGSGNISLNTNQAGAGTAVKTATNSTSAFQVQNAAAAPIFLVDTTTTNLLSNPGFEVNTAGWASFGAGTGLAISQNLTRANAYHGVASLQVTTASNAATTGASVSSFTAAIVPGTYTFSFYAMGGATNGNFATLGVSITGGTTPACILNSTSVVTTGFRQYYCTFTSTTTNVSAINIYSTDAATQHIFYVDAAQLIAGASNAPYSIGGIALRGVVNTPATFQSGSNSTTAFQVADAAGSSLLTADTLNNGVTVKSPTNSSNAFQVQNAGGTAILNVDTSLSRLQVGSLFSANNTPLVANASYTDAFNGASLSGSWTYTAATGGTQSVSGGALTMTLPSGSNHDCFGGTYTCGTVMESIGSQDAQYITEFDGTNPTVGGYYGITFRQDNANWIRFAFVDGTRVSMDYTLAGGGGVAYIASTGITMGAGVAGTSGNMLRITRTGNLYMAEYSVNNGTTWNYVGGSAAGASVYVPWLTPAQAGITVGNYNGASAPAVTAKVNYFNVNDYYNGMITQGISVKASSGNAFQIQDANSNTLFNIDTNSKLITTNNGTDLCLGYNNCTNQLAVMNANGAPVLSADTGSLRVGIGTTTPNFKLDVFGDTNITTGSSYRINGTTILDSNSLTFTNPATNIISGASNQALRVTSVGTSDLQLLTGGTGVVTMGSSSAGGTGSTYLQLRSDGTQANTTGSVFSSNGDKTVLVGNTGSTTGSSDNYIGSATAAAQSVSIGGTAINTASSNSGTVVNLQGGGNAISVTNTGVTVKSLNNSANALLVQDGTGTGVLNVNTAILSTTTNGSFGGNVVNSIDNASSLTQTINVPGKAYGYYLSANTGTLTNGGVATTTYTINNLPQVDGTSVFITAHAIKSATTTANLSKVVVTINGNTVVTSYKSPATTAASDYLTSAVIMRLNGVWRAIGTNEINSDGADLAEWIHYDGMKPQPGQLLRSSNSGMAAARLADGAYDPTVIGVVTTDPGKVLGIDDGHAVAMALTGRVPVQVSTENGVIQPGDLLTSSSIPGIAMRATEPGEIIGTALTGYTGTGDAMVMTQIHVGYAAPAASATANSLQGSGAPKSDHQKIIDLQHDGSATQTQFTSLQDQQHELQGQLAKLGTQINTGGVTSQSLTVTGNAAIQGDLTVSGVAKLRDLQISTHISLTSTDAPTFEVQSAAGTTTDGHGSSTNNSLVTINGNDNAGTITITTGDSPTSNILVKLRFHQSFTSTPQIVISPASRGTSSLGAYTEGTSKDGFDLGVDNVPQAKTTYKFTYHTF